MRVTREPHKATANLKKHRLAFEEAAAALADALAIAGADPDHSLTRRAGSPLASRPVSGSLPRPIPKRAVPSALSAHGRRHAQNVGSMKRLFGLSCRGAFFS